MTTIGVLEQERNGVPFKTTVGGETVELRESRENAFRIENVHGQPTVIINPNFEFAFPDKFKQIAHISLVNDAVLDGPMVRRVVSRSFVNCLDLGGRFSDAELKSLEGLEHGHKTLLYRLCSLHMLLGILDRDNINFDNDVLLELAKDKDLNVWVINHYKSQRLAQQLT